MPPRAAPAAAAGPAKRRRPAAGAPAADAAEDPPAAAPEGFVGTPQGMRDELNRLMQQLGVPLPEDAPSHSVFSNELQLYERFFFAKYSETLGGRGTRHDARGLGDPRRLQVRPAGLSHAHGSTLVTVGESTRVLCGVKGMLAPPLPGQGSRGRLKVRAMICPTASARVSSDFRGSHEEASSLGEFVQHMLETCNTVDLNRLCVREDVVVWSVHVDLYVLDSGGSLRDACLCAASTALLSARLPVMTMSDEGKPVRAQPPQAEPLQIAKYPIAVTFGCMGNKLLCDPDWKEEQITSSLVTVVFDSIGKLVSVHKPGGFGASFIGRDTLRQAIDGARRVAKQVKDYIEAQLR
eukprot:TRINITY_DN11221_c0_g1_i1.p2 TRINITY_DN11221_c0_g1~~TRINITY_DN11221_c0_g1_i1.p2  ORF type:complete len:376 (+),score=113.80 TRINITY_DN11221_c0_g1_i1:77-1129(+)